MLVLLIVFLVIFTAVLLAVSLGFRVLEARRKQQVTGMLRNVTSETFPK
jgi:uncharacterized protein YpmB